MHRMSLTILNKCDQQLLQLRQVRRLFGKYGVEQVTEAYGLRARKMWELELFNDEIVSSLSRGVFRWVTLRF